MKKSNWIVFGLLLVASIFLLWLWNYLHFYQVHMLDLYLSILWWVLIVVLCVVIAVVEKKRREKLRTTYVGKKYLFNNNIGITPLAQGELPSSGLIRVLSDLPYDMNVEEFGEDDIVNRSMFDFIVRTKKFKDYGNVWEGEVVPLDSKDTVLNFDGKSELMSIINVSEA